MGTLQPANPLVVSPHGRSSQGGPSLSLQREQLEELYSAHSDSMSVLLEEDGSHTTEDGFPQGPANFTLLWSLFV